MPPHPSDAKPQFCPEGQVLAGWQQDVPTHVWPVGQLPQFAIVPPHPSDAVPQFCPDGHEVLGTQLFAKQSQVNAAAHWIIEFACPVPLGMVKSC
jgi:hypothetical protein